MNDDPVAADLPLPPVVPTHARLVLTLMIGVGVLLWGSIGGIVGNVVVSAQNKIVNQGQGGLLKQLGMLANTQSQPLKGEKNDRINTLLLGYGGAGHEGGGLTDTIMVISMKPSTHEVVMISIPRDLVVNFGGKKPAEQEWRKINYAYDRGGIDFAEKKVEEVLGIPIQYNVAVDFEGFRKIIDDMGGVDVYVENGFTDSQYPDYHYGYQTIAFDTGWQHLTGERALQYARSRHGNHNEGGDIARSHRQQVIIQSVRDQVLSAGTLLNPTAILSIITDLGDHVKTNAQLWELARLLGLAKDIPKENIVNKVISQGEGGFLDQEIVPETGAFIFLPKAGLGNYSEIQHMVDTVFDEPELVKEQAKVVVQNGTKVAGLGGRTGDLLRNSQFDVASVSNAVVRDAQYTLLLDLTGGKKPAAQEELATLMHVTPEHISSVSLEQLDPLVINTKEVPPDSDFLVVVGLDYSLAK